VSLREDARDTVGGEVASQLVARDGVVLTIQKVSGTMRPLAAVGERGGRARCHLRGRAWRVESCGRPGRQIELGLPSGAEAGGALEALRLGSSTRMSVASFRMVDLGVAQGAVNAR